jgi:O-antigen/teichoic acid export membrane protein
MIPSSQHPPAPKSAVPAWEDDLAQAAVQGLLWSLAARYGARGVAFLSVAGLSRVFTPGDLGVVSSALMAIGVLHVLRGLGFDMALLGSVHDALLRKELRFKRKLVPDMTRALVDAAVTVPLALLGCGAWSLVCGQLGATLASVAVLWSVCNWRPILAFSPRVARSLFAYSSKIFGLQLIGPVMKNLDNLVAAPFVGAGDLGVYSVAGRLPRSAIEEGSGAASQVLFPVYSKLRGDVETMSRGFITATRYLAAPLRLTLAVLAGVPAYFGLLSLVARDALLSATEALSKAAGRGITLDFRNGRRGA